jgi:hypothetical protein
MSRPKKPIPTPRCHKGRVVVDIYDGGTRRTVTLGAWGSPEAEREFARILAEGRSATTRPVGTSSAVSEVLLTFLRWAPAQPTHHELERGQARREGEAIAPPAVADVDTTVDSGPN